jgi:tRNA(Glu) U13 pseudouridine synthase TruD
MDEHGHYVRLAFDLPPGVYATVVLREIMKGGGPEGGGGGGEDLHHRGTETHGGLTEEGMD